MAINKPLNQPDVPFLFLEKRANVKGLASSALATADLPVGPTYYGLRLHCKTSAGGAVSQATIENDINYIRLKLDGETFIDLKPEEIFMLQKYYKDSRNSDVVAGVIYIDLSETHLNLPGERDQLAWGTSDIGNFSVEVETGTLTATTGLSGGSIEVFPVVSNVRQKLGAHKKILPFSRTFASTGKVEIDTLPKRTGSAYRALHIEDGSGTIDDVAVIVNNVQIVQEIPARIMQQHLEDCQRNPQTGWYHLDWNPHNEVLGFLPMIANGQPVSEFIVKPNFSVQPDNFRILAEIVEGL